MSVSASAIFLILKMYTPYGGLILVSNAHRYALLSHISASNHPLLDNLRTRRAGDYSCEEDFSSSIFSTLPAVISKSRQLVWCEKSS
jgi:hypothetical protein